MENSRLNHPSSHKGGRVGFLFHPRRSICRSPPLPSLPTAADVPFTKGISLLLSYTVFPQRLHTRQKEDEPLLSRARAQEVLQAHWISIHPAREGTHSYSLNLFLLGDLLCTSPCAVTKTFPRLCVPQVISVSFGFQTRSRQRG